MQTSAMTIIDSPEPIDLLLTDIVMPGDDGRPRPCSRRGGASAVAAHLADLGLPGCPVERFQPCRTGGRLLSKPYRKEELRRVVREMLDEPSGAFRRR